MFRYTHPPSYQVHRQEQPQKKDSAVKKGYLILYNEVVTALKGTLSARHCQARIQEAIYKLFFARAPPFLRRADHGCLLAGHLVTVSDAYARNVKSMFCAAANDSSASLHRHPGNMLAPRWSLLLAYPHTFRATECLVGCLVQGISPFDDDGLAVWDDRGTCDSSNVGCTVDAINYPLATSEGALWASTSGTNGSSACTCNICDPYPWSSDATRYMAGETSLWSRIHCFLAASEASGYDVSPCVAAILDTEQLPCVDDVYEPPAVDQFDCQENAIEDLVEYSSYEECGWDGDVRTAQELFPSTPASSSTNSTSSAVYTNSCLVGCLLQGISPFDDDGLAVWDNRGTCDSPTIGCAVSAISYPTSSFGGALWASSWGSEGSSDCTCSICDPHDWYASSSYMSGQASLWSRIHCYLAASEASGYDVSPCVAAILGTETLPCVDDVYEPPAVDQFECEENGLADVTTSASYDQCVWDGNVRMAQELFSAALASSLTTAATSVAVNTTTCLVGCSVQGINPFADDGQVVWDGRATCDSNTIGCEVNAIRYPSLYYEGALWASSRGADGSTGCKCDICDPRDWGITSGYMSDQASVWSRIHCYLSASEASGYDVSPCVAAIVDTGTLPCVDDEYEPPTVDQFECVENGLEDLTDYSFDQCVWDGEYRSTGEFYGGTRAPSSYSEGTLTEAPEPTPVAPSTTSPPIEGGATPPTEPERASCAVGAPCQDNFCCHPDTNTCGRSELIHTT